jgi:hypothetical protein
MSAPGLSETATTTLRNRDMPERKPKTKAAKQAAVHEVMHEFKHGKLRSGSKHGPKVTSRPQAVAIALHESGQSRSASQPSPKTNPGAYDTSAHGDADKAPPAEKFRGPQPNTFDAAAKAATNRERGVGMQPTLPMRHEAPAPVSYFETPRSKAHGFGHSVTQRSGPLRLSGVKGAHRIGVK